METALEKKDTVTAPALKKEPENSQLLAAYQSDDGFKLLQRMALSLSESDIVPETYRKKPANCMIALELANRMQISPLMVMQNLYVVQGKPAWGGSFVISAINSCGKFQTPLNFEKSGTGDDRTCYAWAIDKAGNRIEGTPVSIRMAKDEGWFGKNGSKWKTMPEQMLCYRSGTFFGRIYCPEVLMGMQTDDEINDVQSPIPTILTDEQMKHVKDTINAGQPEEAEKVVKEITLTPEQKQEIENEVSKYYEKHPKQGTLL